LLGATLFHRRRGLQKSLSPNDLIPKQFLNKNLYFITLIIKILWNDYSGEKIPTAAQATGISFLLMPFSFQAHFCLGPPRPLYKAQAVAEEFVPE